MQRQTRSNAALLTAGVALLLALCATDPRAEANDRPAPATSASLPLGISGRYPDLAMFNQNGECGTGAVAPWAGRLWVITYGPHLPNGSDDKLYEIDPDLGRVTRPESVGGTPADRMIHRESNQLIIGPYFIDAQRKVRAISPKKMPGRLTAAARSLDDPADKVYLYDMEGALYEVDVHSLAVKRLFVRAAPGAHGKGAYTAQGRLVVANNGNDIVNKAAPAAADPGYAHDPESDGCLAEWDGAHWSIVSRRQFTDITGPGGIDGAPSAQSPLWAIGWDKRSVILKLLDGGKWSDFRLPVADYSYVAKHGWYTEWPRIRDVGGKPGTLLMNMHGQWFEFPRDFSADHSTGIRPVGDYLKITGDFCPWSVAGKPGIVFACDDASIMQNPLLGQSQSNLWFSDWSGLKACGRPAGFGGPWVSDAVKAGEPSTPYLIAGYDQRVLHLTQDSDEPVTFKLETDARGAGQWSSFAEVTVAPHGYVWKVLPADLAGDWIRLTPSRDCTATAYFHFGPGGGATTDAPMFAALPDASAKASVSAGELRPLGGDRGTLLFESRAAGADDAKQSPVSWEVGPDMHFRRYAGPPVSEPTEKGAAAPYSVSADAASIVLRQGKNRFRLPRFDADCDRPIAGVSPRSIREIVTERFIVNAGGSMFVLPRETAGGARRIKPICTHDKRISDFCSWRGLTVLTGAALDARPDGHYFAAADAGPGLWFGDIDDLWRLGKARGHGGPWLNSAVAAGAASDPYLMVGYDHKTLALSHDAATTVHMTAEVDFLANGDWVKFHEFDVPAGQTVKFEFPAGYSAHWIRFRCDAACRATAQLDYD